ncbi:MAG TPA: hypothetical protein DDW49_04280 [Deltaproteobacteria bacterium]|nr:hypothetical protein [Deltaproteobacteria bacterium]
MHTIDLSPYNPPLKKGGRGDLFPYLYPIPFPIFQTLSGNVERMKTGMMREQIPLSPPFLKGDIMRGIIVNHFCIFVNLLKVSRA